MKLGLSAKLYLNSAFPGGPTWVEISNVKDLTLNLEKGEADVTTRANLGWRATVGTLKDASIEFQMVKDDADPNFAVLAAAFFTNGAIEMAVMDGPITATTSEGLRAVFGVFNFSRSEALEEAIMVDVTIKPTYAPLNPPTWVTGGP